MWRKIAIRSRNARGDQSTHLGVATPVPAEFGGECTSDLCGAEPAFAPGFLLGLVEAAAEPFQIVKMALDGIAHQGFGARAGLLRYPTEPAR